VNESTLLGLAALLTALGGLGGTILALRKHRTEEAQDCFEHLAYARQESERLATELHQLKMEQTGEG
jgi:hypothetical protein